MSSKSNSGKNENRGNWKNNRRRHPRSSFFKPSLECCICGKNIKEVTSAMSHGEEHQPAHFECVMKQLKEKEKLADGERLVYIGNGSFAIIKNQSGGGRKKFEIVKKLELEERDKKPEEWRMKMRARVDSNKKKTQPQNKS